MTEQNEGPTTGPQTLVGDSAPVARELDGQVAVLTVQHRPHNLRRGAVQHITDGRVGRYCMITLAELGLTAGTPSPLVINQ